MPSVKLHEEAAEATEASAKIAEATEKRMVADDVWWTRKTLLQDDSLDSFGAKGYVVVVP